MSAGTQTRRSSSAAHEYLRAECMYAVMTHHAFAAAAGQILACACIATKFAVCGTVRKLSLTFSCKSASVDCGAVLLQVGRNYRAFLTANPVMGALMQSSRQNVAAAGRSLSLPQPLNEQQQVSSRTRCISMCQTMRIQAKISVR